MFNKISIFLFSILPITLILGNFAINLNILIIDLFALYFCFKIKNWNWTREKFFKLLIIFYLFLIINSLVSYYFSSHATNAGLIRSITFIKFVLFAYSFRILITNSKIFEKIMISWSFIIGIVIFDIFFESIFGHNIIGNVSPDHTRIISFFKDEIVVGALILCFGFIIATYYLNKDLDINFKFLFNLFLILIPLSIFLTGERSNFIKSTIIFCFIIFFINEKKLLFNKKNYLIFLFIAFSSLMFFNQNIFIKQTEFFKRLLITNNNNDDLIEGNSIFNKFQNIKYFAHYDVSLKIFREYPLFGVANKNFRHECHNKKYFDNRIKLTEVRCNTHPHQIHFELLSEHGIVGYIFFFYMMFVGLKKFFNNSLITKNIFHYSAGVYLIVFFIPVIPSGSFFSTFNGTLFWLIFALANADINKLKKSFI